MRRLQQIRGQVHEVELTASDHGEHVNARNARSHDGCAFARAFRKIDSAFVIAVFQGLRDLEDFMASAFDGDFERLVLVLMFCAFDVLYVFL